MLDLVGRPIRIPCSALLVCSLAFAGCLHSDGSGSEPAGLEVGATDQDGSDPFGGFGDAGELPPDADYVLDYEGPELSAGWVEEGVRLSMPAAPGGSSWSYDGPEIRNGDVRVVVVRLDVPPGQPTGTTSLETVVPVDEAGRRIEIRVGLWEKGVQYLIPPENHLAAVLTR
ncbi:MAG: hypothetical protein AAF196_14140 [Planctomycetota bacterium]